MKAKYKTLMELAEAFRSGELNRTDYQLVLDNDDSWLQFSGPLPKGMIEDSPEADAWRDARNDECRALFRGNGYSDISDACTAAGIPNSWC